MGEKRKLYDFLREYEADDGNIDRSYSDLYNAVIDYENKTRDWQFEGLFEDFVDDELVAMRIKELANDYDWSTIQAVLTDIDESGVYRVDAYGNFNYIEATDLNSIRDEILSILSEDFE